MRALESFDRFCRAQQLRILTRFHGTPYPHYLFTMGPDPDDANLIDGEPLDKLWGQQRLMVLGPRLTALDWHERVVMESRR